MDGINSSCVPRIARLATDAPLINISREAFFETLYP
jgi:hypothetical protein